MSALTVDPAPGPGQDWDDLVRIWEETDAPEGCKVEIIEEIVTVSPPPSKDHNTTAELLQRRLYTGIPEEWGIYQTLGLSLPGRGGIYIPDLVVVDRATATGPGNTVPAEEARLVVEITSRANANHDRVSKVNGYAKAGVELFLLLDPGTPAARPRRFTASRRTVRTECWRRSSTGVSSPSPSRSDWSWTPASSPSADTRTARRTDALRAAGRRCAWGELPASARHLPRYAL